MRTLALGISSKVKHNPLILGTYHSDTNHLVRNFMRKRFMTEIVFQKKEKVQNLSRFTERTDKNTRSLSPQTVAHNFKNVPNGMM